MSDHYFTAQPATPAEQREIRVELAGAARTVVTAGGIFSPGHVDHATQVLLDHVPQPPATGTLLDLGCGWGPLALTLALLSPEASVRAVDVNERALALTTTNAARLACDRLLTSTPEQVPADERYDLIWSNPPIRIGKDALHALLLHWLPRLAPGGAAYLVVGKNLGSDSLQTWLGAALPQGFSVTRHASSKGFRVLRVDRD